MFNRSKDEESTFFSFPLEKEIGTFKVRILKSINESINQPSINHILIDSFIINLAFNYKL